MNSAQMPDVVEKRATSRRPTASEIFAAFMGQPQPGMANGGAVNSLAGMPMMQGAFKANGGRLVDGQGTGRSDDVVASMDAFADTRLSRGEYVIPADVVSAMGDGSTDAGAEALNNLVETTRQKWRGKVGRIPSPGDE
jgi:hypothetical protein